MRLDHLLSRENFYLLLRKRNEETLSPQGLIVLGLVLGGLSGIGTIRPKGFVCLAH